MLFADCTETNFCLRSLLMALKFRYLFARKQDLSIKPILPFRDRKHFYLYSYQVLSHARVSDSAVLVLQRCALAWMPWHTSSGIIGQ